VNLGQNDNSVEIPHVVYLALGTNLGDRIGNLHAAVEALSPEVEPLVLSTIYETTPWGYANQPTFLNQVLKAKTTLVPFALLAYFKNIEFTLGRKPNFRYGPRLIDLDILLYNNLVLDTEELTIPHPRIAERAFVLVPLAEIAPDLRHPVLGKTMAQLQSEVDTSGVKPYMTVES
jgi:2-amino-4-hydroxy-6-hydroxymethyldihydropteridine diphosphokinase